MGEDYGESGRLQCDEGRGRESNTDGLVVTPSVKESLVTRTQRVHAAYTWAFGNSPVDLPIIIAAHKSIIVVGEQQNRSKSMGHNLLTAMVNDGLQARQALLPNNLSPPRLYIVRLSVVNLTEKSFLDLIFQPHKSSGGLQLYHHITKYIDIRSHHI